MKRASQRCADNRKQRLNYYMGKLLGLNVGDVRVGTALTDSTGANPAPHRTLERAQGRAEREILQMVEDLAITSIIVGLPLDEQSRETLQSEKIRRFCRRIQKRTEVPIHFVDEYLSSSEAKQRLKLKPSEKEMHDKRG